MTFSDQISVLFGSDLALRAKMYWNLIWKSPGFVPLWANLTHFGAKPTIPVYALLLVSCSFYSISLTRIHCIILSWHTYYLFIPSTTNIFRVVPLYHTNYRGTTVKKKTLLEWQTDEKKHKKCLWVVQKTCCRCLCCFGTELVLYQKQIMLMYNVLNGINLRLFQIRLQYIFLYFWISEWK